MAVRDDWQGKGVGTALRQAAIDLADKWLNLERLELDVYTDNEVVARKVHRLSAAEALLLSQGAMCRIGGC